MRWIAAKFVPCLLSDEQKQNRFSMSKIFRKDFKVSRNFYQRSSQVTKYGLTGTTQNNFLSGRSQSEVNDFFFDMHGIVHCEFVLKGENVNQHLCSDVLRCLWVDVRRKRSKKWRTGDWFLHHSRSFRFVCAVVSDQKRQDCCSATSLLLSRSSIEEKIW